MPESPENKTVDPNKSSMRHVSGSLHIGQANAAMLEAFGALAQAEEML
jgi:hypothetical protein